MEKVLWLIECVKSGLQSFMLEISCWMMMLHGWVDQQSPTFLALGTSYMEESFSTDGRRGMTL